MWNVEQLLKFDQSKKVFVFNCFVVVFLKITM